MPTIATEPERLLDLYEGLLIALDSFEVTRATYREVQVGSVRVDLLRIAGGRLMLDYLAVDPVHAGMGLASCAVRSVVDFADLLGWTLCVVPRPFPGIDVPRLRQFFARFDFHPQPGLDRMQRLPSPL